MTPAQKKLIELDNVLSAFKEFQVQYTNALEQVRLENGTNCMFQDPMTLVVYKLVIPDGKFVTFDKLALKHTKKDGEARGSLSKSNAEEAGFTV